MRALRSALAKLDTSATPSVAHKEPAPPPLPGSRRKAAAVKHLPWLVLLSGTITATARAADQPSWVSESRTGCKVWNSYPKPGERVEWSGGCVSGFASGNGLLQWYVHGKLNEQFEGEMAGGKLNGQGAYIWANGNRYEGKFHDGEPAGHGVYHWANGAYYEGELLDGQPNGWGATADQDGAYEGEFRDGQRNGRGIQTWTDGSRYEGEYRDGRPHGIGSLFDAPSRQTFNGIWRDGCFRDGDRRATVGVPAAECQ